jgi:hypothetical protein
VRQRFSLRVSLERSWAIVCVMAFFFIGSLMLVRHQMAGMGVVRKNKVFVLISGLSTRPIDQTIALAIYILQWVVAAVIVSGVSLTILVLIRHRTISLPVILPGKDARTLRLLLVAMFIFMAISSVITRLR